MAAITITPASVIPSAGAKLQDCQAYETITQGQCVAYIEPQPESVSAPFVRLADATTYYKVCGIAATGGSANQPMKIIKSDPALALGGTVAAGDVAYLGITPGTITVTYADLTTGKFVSTLGVGIGSNKINFNPVSAGVPK